jgi:hypothetical protein
MKIFFSSRLWLDLLPRGLLHPPEVLLGLITYLEVFFILLRRFWLTVDNSSS